MNTKHPLYKEKLKLEKEYWELREIRSNQNLIALEKPYKYGYYKVFDLRDDIKNRDDSWVFYTCLELVGETCWWRDKKFRKKTKKGKYEYVSPGFGYISDRVYEKLHPAVKKYFAEISVYHKNYHPFYKRYTCVAPSFYFVTKVRPHYVTHYREHDSVLERQIAEKDSALSNDKFYGWRYGSGSAPKEYTKCYNRSDRRHNKQAIKKNIKFGGEDMDDFQYRYAHRHSATWNYW